MRDMPRTDYYDMLGVRRDASDEDIKKAYRQLVFQYHPDRHPSDKAAEEKIREINAAYEVVGDAEKRRTYDRLRFGDEVQDEALDPSVVLEQMEQKLFDEGRKELFALMMKDVKRVKAELAIIRERIVKLQGYDAFKNDIVAERAREVMAELVMPDMAAREQRLLDVAVQMMASQQVVRKEDRSAINSLRQRLQENFEKGRVSGFGAALELLYVRR